MTEEEYIKERLEDQIKWYSKKATKNKSFNNWFKSFIIALSATIPFIVGIEFDETLRNIVLSAIGVTITILSGLSGLLKFQEKWTEYRTTSETLKHEKYLFKANAVPYNEEKEPYKLLVTRIEDIISREHSMWGQYINNKNK